MLIQLLTALVTLVNKARFNGEEESVTVGTVAPCHPERSEGSVATGSEMLRCAQHDRRDLSGDEELSRSFEPCLTLTVLSSLSYDR